MILPILNGVLCRVQEGGGGGEVSRGVGRGVRMRSDGARVSLILCLPW